MNKNSGSLWLAGVTNTRQNPKAADCARQLAMRIGAVFVSSQQLEKEPRTQQIAMTSDLNSKGRSDRTESDISQLAQLIVFCIFFMYFLGFLYKSNINPIYYIIYIVFHHFYQPPAPVFVRCCSV